MIHVLAEAEPDPPPAILDDGPRPSTIELSTLTAALVSLRYDHGGRRVARLNAFVDGLGHRTVDMDLTLREHDRLFSILLCPGPLVRCAGVLVPEGTHFRLLHPQGLQILMPSTDCLA